MSATNRNLHSKSIGHAVLWIIFIVAPLLERQYFIFSQCIMQSLIILFLLYLLLHALHSRTELPWKFGLLDLFFPLLALVFLLSGLVHENKYQAFLSLLDSIIFCFFIVAFRQIYQSAHERKTYLPFAFSGLLISLLNILQRFGIGNNLGFANTNVAALYILIASIFSFHYARHYGFRTLRGMLFLIILLINAIAVIIFPSRAIFLILLLIVLMLLFLAKPLRSNRWVQLAAIIIIIISLAGIMYKLSKTSYRWERFSIWKECALIVQKNIWTGVGAGNFQYYAYRYNFPTYESPARYGKFANHAHNQWLHLLCEGGILSLIPLGFFFFYFTKYSFILYTKKLITGVPFFLLFSFVIYGFFNNFFDSYGIMFLFAAVLVIFQNYAELPSLSLNVNLNKTTVSALSLLLIITLLWFVLIPYWADREYSRSMMYNKMEDEGKAFESINAAIRMVPINGAYYRQRARLRIVHYTQTKSIADIPLIVKDFERAKAANALDFNTSVEEAQFYFFLSQHLRYYDLIYNAILNYKLASTLNPYNPFYHYGLSNCYATLRNYKEARQELLISIELEPNYITGYYELSRLYKMTGEEEKARFYYSKAVELAQKYRYYPVSENEYQNILLKIPDDLRYEMQPFSLN